ncbi:hypothetical protein V1512DRAFT_260706 [Lipomyces arxii]|uniref:uncharacterized protein n=1 Tax=Lipomyces arxii TaxID=56418 RepID=UPI0034CE267F
MSLTNVSEVLSCWICLGTSNDPPPVGSQHNWRRPCKCSLVAHESCLLLWIPDGTDSRPCPQCGTVIKVDYARNYILDIQSAVVRLASHVATSALIATAAGNAISVVWGVLYTHGISSVYFMCSLDETLDVIRGGVETGTFEQIFFDTMNNYKHNSATFTEVLTSFWHFLAKRSKRVDFLTMPLVPILLVGSRTTPLHRSGLSALPLVSLYTSAIKDRETGNPYVPVTTYLIFNYAYRIFYAKVVLPSLARWKSEDSPSTPRIENLVDQEEIVNGVHGDAADEEGRVDVVVEMNANLRIGDMDLFVNKRNILPTILGALSFPACSGLMGSLITVLFPKFAKVVPNRFVRSMIGGYTFLMLKDAFSIYSAYAQNKRAKTRRISN